MRLSIAKHVLAIVIGCCVALDAAAHDARPVYVHIQQTGGDVFQVQWNAPSSMARRSLPEPLLPSSCRALGGPVLRQMPGSYLGVQRYRCVDGLSGGRLGVRFPQINPSLTTLFEVRLANGERHFRALKPGEYQWTLPHAEEPFSVAKQYTWLGVQHIWIGMDHLLFVACLVFVARTARRVLITITGFTVAHSLTLALSALDVVRVPVPPVEAVIALSVVFLAVEIARGDRSSLTFRYPVAVSSSFGLLHGFGFASVLREIGLPQTELPLALLFFNVGVEIGQILFVALLVLGYLLLVKTSGAIGGRFGAPGLALRPPRPTLAASYLIGGVASYWMIERLVGFWA